MVFIVTLLSGCAQQHVKTEDLKKQLDEFITESRADGSLDAIADYWMTVESDTRIPDFEALTGENGSITVGTKQAFPFTYFSDGKYTGLVPEIIYRFCEKYGYTAEFMDFNESNSIVMAISVGKCDLGGATISITEERKKVVDYSEPYFNNRGSIIMNGEDAESYTGVSSLDGKRIGVITGSIYHDVVDQNIRSAIVYEYNNPADLCLALYSHKIDAIVYDYAVMVFATKNYPTEKIVGSLIDDDQFAFVFPKTSAGVTNPITRIAQSFERTIIRDNRWYQILKGIGTTLLITFVSIVVGSVLGFGLCMASIGKNKLAIKLVNGFSWVIRGLPTVVLLLIMYYVVFGSSSVSGTLIAIISFSLVFGVSVCGLLTGGIRTVDRGQFEACTALGYSEKKGFYRMILPQAIRFSLPGYKNEIVALIKATAIVGYIAVQDLTKAGDIIRSNTYEAFFPLILTAVIYFILAGALIRIINVIQTIVLNRNKQEEFLKGVSRHA